MIHHKPKDYSAPGKVRTVNVRCLTGDAHARYSYKKEDVTCPACLDTESTKEYWSQKPVKFE